MKTDDGKPRGHSFYTTTEARVGITSLEAAKLMNEAQRNGVTAVSAHDKVVMGTTGNQAQIDSIVAHNKLMLVY